MQFPYLFTALALAMTASALPTGENVDTLAPRTYGTPAASCTNNQQSVCCNGPLGALSCAVTVLGSTCGGQSYCCETNAAPGTVVNVQLLNCVKVG
ncbi:uncharacterized protein B0H64DRAFT_444428 [Chaetomium fimeti]|uniref:Hydrophobin n=1 Tax=Chaetomium fimeti TaxID=1854472 RepID=A0AAE0HAV7_9PEZI|nr:hypothetical protein B0H64DRAFT_444428 [Chaetomium fimeti]